MSHYRLLSAISLQKSNGVQENGEIDIRFHQRISSSSSWNKFTTTLRKSRFLQRTVLEKSLRNILHFARKFGRPETTPEDVAIFTVNTLIGLEDVTEDATAIVKGNHRLISGDMPEGELRAVFEEIKLLRGCPSLGKAQVENSPFGEDIFIRDRDSFSMVDEFSEESVGETPSKDWLMTSLEVFENSNFTTEELYDLVLSILSSTDSNESIQHNLFDLLGYDGFDLIIELISNRSSLCHSSPVTPTFNTSVKTSTKTSAKIPANARKDAWRNHLPSLSEIREFMSRTGRVELPHVYDSNLYQQDSQKLPITTVHQNREKYERFDVPAPPSTETDPFSITNARPLFVRDLDQLVRKAFDGVESLNCIQSTVFETTMTSQENMLIAAPTGAGKTNIALLAILNQIRQHEGPLTDLKIVYIAPMKALACEVTAKMSERLSPFGLSVRELTGDMQLTKKEIFLTQIFVVTPEKLDVVSRKDVDIGMADSASILSKMSLLIIDELQLLADSRGSVLEALVARILRLVESSQRMIRIVGLSATLPNYLDIAAFLRVNLHTGLFFFDGRFRPVPLTQSLVGVKGHIPRIVQKNMDQVCYSEVARFVSAGHQVMVFVTSRNGTVKTANILLEMAETAGQAGMFVPSTSAGISFELAVKHVGKCQMRELRRLFSQGFATHHAGMSRSDRNAVEKYFRAGLIKCLVCTATLAWGVNLPAHAVIIRGTSIYDSKTSSFVNMGVLDVLQIFGRAGRPQYDVSGFGVLITEHSSLPGYLTVIGSAAPIESKFIDSLCDNLNAEIVLGTVSNLGEAVQWVKYSYFYVRLLASPTTYGASYSDLMMDESMSQYCRQLITVAASRLDSAKMIRFDEVHSYFFPTDLGRTASHLYINTQTIQIINDSISERIEEPDILSIISSATEFEQIKVRPDECDELESLEACVPFRPKTSAVGREGKVNILLQSFISNIHIEIFSLVSDQHYVVQNGCRIARALFEIADRNGWAMASQRMLSFCKMLDRQLWGFETPLKQFSELSPTLISRIQRARLDFSRIESMESREIGMIVHNVNSGVSIKRLNYLLPMVDVEATIQPITHAIIRVKIRITPNFRWDDKFHGIPSAASEMYQVWVTDPESDRIYHSETVSLTRKNVIQRESIDLVLIVPIFDPLPPQYYVDVVSNRWVGVSTTCPVSFDRLVLPDLLYSHTELLDLQPLPVTALRDPSLESLYPFSHFNPIQTQVFHSVYHTDHNVLLGAPTGSGKTNVAEMAIFRVFREYPTKKCVYIAPLKALVRERLKDWKERIEGRLGKRVVELTGDSSPDAETLKSADLIVTTPEKWDGISRSWQCRGYVRNVALICIDEIHLLGEERGPVLEVILSRLNFISSQTQTKVRVVGLSTALANAVDIATWLSIPREGLFNFRPSVRPVPLETHISGFPGKHYCPRMASMNRACFRAIQVHSPDKPVLVFVSSRRQTRLTALALVSLLASESDNFRQWLHTPEHEIESLDVTDSNLRLTLPFGVGIHHAGLTAGDRDIVEGLFVQQRIQILVSTATLAWGVNFPAHLVIIKGTEYFDGKTKRYVDFPVTDLLQMMGRAGRPQFDQCGVACILVHDIKKIFYKKFLYDPFPVESNLSAVLTEHINAEIVAGTVRNPQQALEFLSWTYFYRRILSNPNYYDLESVTPASVNQHLSLLIEDNIGRLVSAHCVSVLGEEYSPLPAGTIASFYYLNHQTAGSLVDDMREDMSFDDILWLLTNAREFAEIPVRHNEDKLNAELAGELGVKVSSFDSPHCKALLLLRAHLSNHPFSCVDYVTDCKSALEQAMRIIQAMVDWAVHMGYLLTTFRTVLLIQHLVQGLTPGQTSLLTIPFIAPSNLQFFQKLFRGQTELPLLSDALKSGRRGFTEKLSSLLSPSRVSKSLHFLDSLPMVEVTLSVDNTPVTEGGVVVVDGDTTLVVKMWNINRSATEAFSPRVGRSRTPGWFIVVTIDGELSLRRVRSVHSSVSVVLPVKPGRCTFYLLSDTFVGIDQQYSLCIQSH